MRQCRPPLLLPPAPQPVPLPGLPGPQRRVPQVQQQPGDVRLLLLLAACPPPLLPLLLVVLRPLVVPLPLALPLLQAAVYAAGALLPVPGLQPLPPLPAAAVGLPERALPLARLPLTACRALALSLERA